MKENKKVWTIHTRKDLDSEVTTAAKEREQSKSDFIRDAVRKELRITKRQD